MRRRIAVVAGLLEREGRVLLDLRRPGSHDGGLWEFPGGKRETGETDAQALIRELREELGVEAEVTGPCLAFAEHATADVELTLALYPVRFTGEPRALEVEAIQWFEPAELAGLAVPPADRPLIAAVLARTFPPKI